MGSFAVFKNRLEPRQLLGLTWQNRYNIYYVIIKSFIRENVDRTSAIMTDDFKPYTGLNNEYVEHHVVYHSRKEYVRGDTHTNTAEGYFSLLTRGINGIYHHVSEKTSASLFE